MTDQKLRRITAASISTPARKVKRIAPKPASQLIQSLSWRWIMLPAMAPTTISVNATEIVNHTDNSEAASARPIHKAAINQTFSTATSLDLLSVVASNSPLQRRSLHRTALNCGGLSQPGSLGGMDRSCRVLVRLEGKWGHGRCCQGTDAWGLPRECRQDAKARPGDAIRRPPPSAARS